MAVNGSTSKVYAPPMTAAERTYLKKKIKEQIHTRLRLINYNSTTEKKLADLERR